MLILGVLAVLGAIAKLSLLAAGFTYIYGAFGSTFFWVTWLGLFTKRMNKPAAWAAMISGLVSYLIITAGKISVFGIPTFFVTAGISLIFCLIFMFATKKPPVEAYESFTSDEVSESTLAVVRAIRKDA